MRRTASSALIQSAISKVVYVRNQLKSNHEIVLSVDDLLAFCRSYTDKTIALHKHPDSYGNHRVKSVYLKTDERYDIYYLSGLNNCWMRFVLCKELFHVLLDDPSNCNPNLEGHVQDLFALNIGEPDNVGLNSSQLETVAEIAAMEYLFPLSERKKFNRKNPDYMSIAQQYLVPRDYVEYYLLPKTITLLGEFQYKAIDPNMGEDD